MKNVRIIISILALTAIVSTSLSVGLAFARPTPHARVNATTKIGLAVIAEVNDRGFNSLAYEGLRLAKSQLHVQGSYTVTAQGGDYAAALNEFINQHDNLIVAVGFLWSNALYTVAKQHPKTHFAIVDGIPMNGNTPTPLPNVASLFFRSEQPGYLVGVVAGLMEKDKVGAAKHNTIGMLGAIPLPFITDQMCGYLEGAQSVDKSVTVLSDFAGSFTDPSTGTAIGQKQIAKHADILFGVADASGLGYYKAAKDAGKYAIGFAADQDSLGPQMLTSAEVGVKPAVLQTITAQVHGKFKAGAHNYSLLNGGVGYATDHMHHVTTKIKNYVAGIEKKVESGKIPVNPNCTLPQ
ncbi:MAG TPA: BMP family ABC transporter substrate-binding protein [Chloroflexota bacterium]|jgi:basic membrane protein A|nr:BMP family ABC transporter substrate-binding protein [Chloroflexota bacterium]